MSTRDTPGIAVVDLESHKVLYKVTTSSPPVALPLAVRRGAIATWAPSSIAFIDEGGVTTKLYDTKSPRELVLLRVDASDDSIVWVEGEFTTSETGSPSLGNFVLWSSPFAATPADFKPRRVTGLDSASLRRLESAVVVHRGYALVKVSELEMRLVRLADGQGWKLLPQPEDRWSWPQYVDEEESVTAVGARADLGKDLEMRTFVRLKTASLGPPDVPPS